MIHVHIVGPGVYANSNRNTYVHGIVLVKFGDLVDFAHTDEDGGGAIENRVARAFVGFPGAIEVRDALLEYLAVDGNFGHVGRSCVAQEGWQKL